MPAIAPLVPRHKALAAPAWPVSTIDGGVARTGTTDRMINSFAMPGRALGAGARIAREYDRDGRRAPRVVVLTLPAGREPTNDRFRSSREEPG